MAQGGAMRRRQSRGDLTDRRRAVAPGERLSQPGPLGRRGQGAERQAVSAGQIAERHLNRAFDLRVPGIPSARAAASGGGDSRRHRNSQGQTACDHAVRRYPIEPA